MHRFWIYPLILGVVGALFPMFWMEHFLLLNDALGTATPGFNWDREMRNVFWDCLPYGFGAGVLLGLGATWREHGRRSDVSQSGAALVARLLANIGWLLGYALLFDASIGLTLWGVGCSGWTTSRLTLYYLSSIFAVVVGLVNLVAIVWAARRSVHTDDTLNPRRVLLKVRASTQMTPRVRKPSRFDRG